MDLGPHHGTWVSVEDGVEVLDIRSGGETSDASDDSNGVQVIEERPNTRMSSKRTRLDLEVSVFPSKRQRNSPACSKGLLSKCGHQNAGNIFLISCMHNTCRECLMSKVESVVNKAMITLEPSYDEIKVQLLCPDQRCGIELSRVELTGLLGIDLIKEYENWLHMAFNDVYGAHKVNCIKCQQEMTIKCPMMPSIKRKGKAKVSDDVNRFWTASSDGRTQCPESWMCQNCDVSWCAACGFAFDFKGEVNGSKGNHVCSEASNYMIWNIVADLKSIYNEYTRGSKTDSQPDSAGKSDDGRCKTDKPIEQPGASFSSNITPFGMLSGIYGSNNCKNTVWGAGTGFGGHRRESKSTQDKVRKIEKELDRRTENVLKSLTNVLKNFSGNRLQPILSFTEYVLLCSDNVLAQLLAFLVMNDSMIDICARGALYMQLAELLKTMTSHQELLRLLKGSSFQTDRNEESDVHGNNGNDTSIINKLKNIYEQSKIIVNRFKDGKHDTVEADIDIARCLLECYEKLSIAAEKQKSSTPLVISVSDNNHSGMTGDSEVYSSQTSSDSDEDGSRKMEKKEVSLDQCKKTSLYKETLKPLQFGEYPMLETTFRRHTYSKHFNESGSNKQSIDNKGEHNKKRMLHIAKEIASLVTNLPLEWESSIHARVDPVRMDLLKALIVGPRGTPYQNGIFLFDIYLPPDYPQVPPKVTFLTTGCGKVRFNPNLYADGKVCLSLLGTWDGPSWQPWKSTLLQVLVSIQSLIFVADPYYNEPGHEVRTDSRDAAEGENRTHRCNTLKYAILDALRDPDPSFKDVIITHFRQKTEEIIEQCSEWAKNASNRSKGNSDAILKIVDDVVLEVVKVSPF